MQFIDLNKQYRRIKPRIHERINQVLQHGTFIMGPEVAELEESLAAFAHLGYRQGDFPVSEQVSESIVSLPMHPYLDDQDQVMICEAIHKAHQSLDVR
jgi:dTDP-4-amino-4,6-dideoxygalactose transaminase